MNITEWIRRNRKEIDNYTGSQYKNDEERRLWTENDEFLHNCCRRNIDLGNY